MNFFTPLEPRLLTLIAAAGFYAGIQNALAGGGSFVTFPALLLAGLNPLAANITSTVALFPGQIATSWAGRKLASDVGRLRFRYLFLISLLGGICGAVLLLNTPVSVFSRLVPWLVLFATSVFAWGSFRRTPINAATSLPLPVIATLQFCIAVYGGYFGGGIGFLMLALLTIAGLPVRMAGATKNVLGMAMNAAAAALFIFSMQVHWAEALVLGGGAIGGGLCGAWLMKRLPERLMRGFIVVVGVLLTAWLFIR